MAMVRFSRKEVPPQSGTPEGYRGSRVQMSNRALENEFWLQESMNLLDLGPVEREQQATGCKCEPHS